MPEKLRRSLQEDLLTLLVHSEDQGRNVFKMVEAALFEGEYRVIAERALIYWKDYNQPPGRAHMSNLLEDIVDDPKNRRAGTMRGILATMAKLAPEINTVYTLDQLSKFVRLQKMKGTIIKASERLNQKQEMAIEEVESMFVEFLRTRELGFNAGLRLDDVDKMLHYMASVQGEFTTGITMLDQNYIVPARQTLFYYLGEAKTGKSWLAVQLGKAAFLQRKKVLHISTEMGDASLLQRYHQSMFAIPKRTIERVPVTRLLLDEKNRLNGFSSQHISPEFSLVSREAKVELLARLKAYGNRPHENLVLTRFAPNTLTLDGLQVYLDNLESTERFVPDLLIMDMPQKMKFSVKDFRLELGRTVDGLRAIGVERNMAVVGTHQVTRKGAGAKLVTGRDIAEDWSIIGIADTVVTYTRTAMERSMGLARLFVDRAREEKDGLSILITQAYDIGQFCLEAAMLPHDYADRLMPRIGQAEEDEGESGGS